MQHTDYITITFKRFNEFTNKCTVSLNRLSEQVMLFAKHLST